MFAAVDMDADGKLSFVEVMNAKMADFTAADGNGDGRVSFEEVMAFEQQAMSTPMSRPIAIPRLRPLALAAVLVLGACAQGQNYDTGTTSLGGVGLGTGGGAAAGALGRPRHRRQARQYPGDSRRCACSVASPATCRSIGPNQLRGQQEQQAAATAGQQRQLDFQRQSQLQQAQVEREIEEQKLYEEWKRERGGGATPAAVNTQADVMTAQRLLTALGYYRGPIDGIYGGGTRSAVMQFEGSQGLPRTGYLTPSLISTMKAAL